MPLAGAFADAWAAAGYLGQLIDLAEARPVVQRGHDRWWVLADIPLNLGRELIELAGGRGYLRRSDRLLPDPGWGLPLQSDDPAGAALTELPEVPTFNLVKAAGMHARPATPRERVVALVPTARAASLLRRALDLRLHATFRPVQLRALFRPDQPPDDAHPGQQPASGTLIEVRLEAVSHGGRQNRYVSEGLIAVLDTDPAKLVLVCREASPRLLVQHDRHSPLTDRQLDALVDGDTWVLADPPHGCWSLSPLADFAEAGSLVRLGSAHRLAPGDESWPDRDSAELLPQPAELRIVPTPPGDAPVDALLLDDDDLTGLPPLLEGHPLAEFAVVVPGRDRHLLLAPGGIAERIPLGVYLSCVGPGPVYLAHGWRTDPLLPATAWRQLISLAPGTAMVLEPDRTLAFDLSLRRPVWELWAGDLPPFDPQLPAEATEILTGIDAQLRTPALQLTNKAGGGKLDQPADAGQHKESHGLRGLMARFIHPDRAAKPQPLTWQEQALEAELAGNLIEAARLHDQHGEPRQAGHLYERAAFEGPERSQ